MHSILSIARRPCAGSATNLHSQGSRPIAKSSVSQGSTSAPRLRTRGFTLIEILVVVVILGILAMIVIPRVMEEPGRARVVRARQDIASIVAALSIYKLDNFVYPSTEQGLEALVTKPSGEPNAPNWSQRLDRVPKDPWGHPYQYQHPGQHGEIDVFSYGADGKAGGEGEAADIGNWDS
ncbi:MAG TPA: type II secretion system major pseudopilin GspG [Rhodanobacteraceae bacterium]|jgi:general secretion pathway protein G|nr:type II secretion system major pseudopilin GspG [Rhodanobacteraceae bacterium]